MKGIEKVTYYHFFLNLIISLLTMEGINDKDYSASNFCGS